jgi:hypothetical protein
LAYQKPDADPRHVKAVEPGLDVESDALGSLVALPLEHALGDGCYCWVMTSLDGIERLGETLVEVVNLWRPLGIRGPCIIPGTATAASANQSLFRQKADNTVPLLNGYSEPASIGVVINVATVCAFLNRWVWCRHGERDIALIKHDADIWWERDGREIDQFLK